MTDATTDATTNEPSLSTWIAGTILRWRLAAIGILAAWGIAGIAMLVLPQQWRASASFTPNQSSTSGAGRLAGALGALGGGVLGGLAGSLATSPDPSESPLFYEQLLYSRELVTRLLQSRFPDPRPDAPADSATLLDIRNTRTKDRAKALELEIREFRKSMVLGTDLRANLVAITVDTEWPELSPLVVQRMLDLVNAFNLQQRQTRGRVRRVFLEGRIDSTRAELAAATRAIRNFEVENRFWRDSPTLKAVHQDLERQQAVAEDLYLSVRRDYEQARLAEVNDAALITVIDAPVVPRKRQFPRVGLTLGVATVLGALAGLLAALIAAAAADWGRADPVARRIVSGALAQAAAEMRALGRRAPAP